MRRSRHQATFAILAVAAGALAAGCGPHAPPLQMSVTFTRQALLQDADSLALYVYESPMRCADIGPALPRPESFLGPFFADLDNDEREDGLTIRLVEIPVGRYVVYVDALDAAGAVVGSGCAEDQRILEDETAQIQVSVM